MKNLGQRIKMIRQGTSRSVFSKRLGISAVTLKRYEDGLREADPAFLERLISDQNLSRDWLLNGIGPIYRDTQVRDVGDMSSNSVQLLASLHDLGKGSPQFQAPLKKHLLEEEVSDGQTNGEEENIQHIESINLHENKNVRRVGQTGDIDILDRYLRAVDENNALIRENADLRVQAERHLSRIRELERENEDLRKMEKKATDIHDKERWDTA